MVSQTLSSSAREHLFLPWFIQWPTAVPGVTHWNYTDTDIQYFAAEVRVDETCWAIEPDPDSKYPVDLSRIYVSWKIEIDPSTNDVWAIPAYAGVRVRENSGSPSLESLFLALPGFGKRKIGTFVSEAPSGQAT